MVLVCRDDNDLYVTLESCGHSYPRFDTPGEALQAAGEGSGMLILCDSYPVPGFEIDRAFLDAAAAKSLRVYIEYPGSLEGMQLGKPQAVEWERVVVTSDFFSPSPSENEIIGLHGCWFMPVQADGCHLAAARVAGYRHAFYGLPEKYFPILMPVEGRADVLLAVSRLSNFVTGRYGPGESWQGIWKGILGWAMRTDTPPELDWQMTVRPRFGEKEPLPADAERQAYDGVVSWFRNHAVYSIGKKKGVVEGFESGIDYRGRQMLRAWPRGDCIGESGMLFACDWMLKGNPDSRHLAAGILDYVWSAPDFRQDDPCKPCYGLNNWYERAPVFYGDDNARVIIPSIAASILTGETRWHEYILRCLLANLRTSGPDGFRKSRFDYPESFKDGKGWKYYRDSREITYTPRPHYQAYLWAAFLWGYALTGHRPFLEKTANAIRMTMEAYADGLYWTNGISQEMARMLLPLAWLIRVDDKSEYRRWLDRIFTDLSVDMQPCGAIRERLGKEGRGNYPPPKSNERYGCSEAPLIQENGDPCCDLLYTMGYAFIGLHEAYLSTGDERIKKAEDLMADFLCRIQVHSQNHPYLAGAWMRGFDYRLWDYWGSSADVGWGAWSIESGWTNTWIGATMALRKTGRPLFDVSTADSFAKRFPEICEEMSREYEEGVSNGEDVISGQAPGAEN